MNKRGHWFQNNLKMYIGLNLRLKSLFLPQSPPPQRIQVSPQQKWHTRITAGKPSIPPQKRRIKMTADKPLIY